MSDIDVRIANEKELEMWDTIVDSCAMGTVFHKLDWLRAGEKHTKSSLYPLIGYEGREVVSLFPVFYKRRAFIKMAFSPPPKCAIPYMGPIFRYLSSRQSSIEKLHNNIIDKALHFLVDDLNSDYVSIKTPKHMLDVRAFLWGSLKARPNYTYTIPIERSTTSLFEGLSSVTRTRIRRAQKEERFQIRKGDVTDFKTLIRMTIDRYQEQGKVFGPSSEYLMKIFESFPDNIDVVKLVYDGEIIGGLILLKYREVVAHWLAGTTPRKKIRGANELLHWWVIENYKEKGYKYYELMGANTKHLCSFKSKFNPGIDIYFNMTKRNFRSKIAESIHNRLSKVKHNRMKLEP